MAAEEPRRLTGRAVLLIAVCAFGVILAANLTLAYNAVHTFSGLVVQNSYVASQGFDATRDAQEALGWQLTLEYADEALRLDLADGDGETVRPAALAVTVGRPTTEREDRVLDLVETPGGYAAAVPLGPGRWRVAVSAEADDGTAFTQRRTLTVRQAP